MRIVSVFLALISSASLWSQFVTRVAVVDMNKVYQAYFRESEDVRRLEQLKTNIQNEINRLNAEIRQVEQQMINARSSGDQRTAILLEEDLQKKREYLREYSRIKQAQLNNEREALTRSPSFLTKVQDAIRFVAESRGFTIVFRIDDPNMLYYNVESDITNFVIERLK